jgi:hypothetical protein
VDQNLVKTTKKLIKKKKRTDIQETEGTLTFP